MIPKLVYHPDYVAPLPPGHRFPMPKFGALHALLLRRGLTAPADHHQPLPAPPAWLMLAHEPGYVQAILTQSLAPADTRRLGLPVTAAVARRAQAAVGGSVLAARLALEYGFAANLAGGSHHAFAGFGSGFCVFNDVAVAIRLLRAEGLIRTACVIDLDVHQGDGTAAILAADDGVSTLSVHCRTNFPARKQFSTLDILLEPGTGDADYLAVLTHLLPAWLERCRPDIVFFNAGVDPHALDKLGRLSLSDRGLAEREAHVMETCRRQGLPLVAVLGGGYADDVEEIAARHAILHAVARDLPSW